ncbi:hypothetical protein DPMN_172111 [Dreissena polymorpha]|uniref:Uncharacterized protein n=1 Tax=Dreissena polymorpha TaxID=45954 RepID=A0A9D4E1N1_DREPO|nr:hypothetical protein DPMN_172111 [Dreissena polymorpha]
MSNQSPEASATAQLTGVRILTQAAGNIMEGNIIHHICNSSRHTTILTLAIKAHHNVR